MRRQQIPFKVKIELLEHLRMVTEPNGEGFVKYKRGWSDEVVAQQFKTSGDQVKRFRGEEVGKLRHANGSPHSDRMADLEEALDSVIKRVEALESSLHITDQKRLGIVS